METRKEVDAFVDEFEKILLNTDKIAFNFDKKWSSNFPNKPGIYAIFDQGELVYIGETADLKERMKDVKRTYNHSFRKKLGRHLYDAQIVKNKYSDQVEADLNEYFELNLTFTFRVLIFGRLEVETCLINRNKKTLLNSIGKRGNKIE